jgi:murein peptide amidase A
MKGFFHYGLLAAALLLLGALAMGSSPGTTPSGDPRLPALHASAPSADGSVEAARQTADAAAQALATAQQLNAWCQALAGHLQALPAAQCRDTGLQLGLGRSVRGVPLWSRDVQPPTEAPRLKVLVLGGIHGDELASVNLVFDWLARVVAAPTPGIHWRMVPLVNPDGLMQKRPTRYNARGVDLNRNFPTSDWLADAQTYWVNRTGKDPRRYPGPVAMSEPETRWVQQQVEQFQPDLIVSVHAPYGVLDFDGPPPPPDRLGSLYLDQVGIYPGSLGNYAGVTRRMPVVTLELKNARSVAVADSAAMWSDLLAWIDRRLIQVAQAPSCARPPCPAQPTP